MKIAKKHGLTSQHITAIQAIGIRDVGKARHFQNGTDRGTKNVQKLARDAKEILAGYFREFTFPIWKTAGWTGANVGKRSCLVLYLTLLWGQCTTFESRR
jgi:hypothetical protein